jgi:hypothetical protein
MIKSITNIIKINRLSVLVEKLEKTPFSLSEPILSAYNGLDWKEHIRFSREKPFVFSLSKNIHLVGLMKGQTYPIDRPCLIKILDEVDYKYNREAKELDCVPQYSVYKKEEDVKGKEDLTSLLVLKKL